jgi:riboflavin biosynthesis pyrimidine reductase
MKPHVICHMGCSVDGRTLLSRWNPRAVPGAAVFERLHDRLAGDAWLIGRVTGREYAKREAYPAEAREVFPREAWIAQRAAGAYGIVLDARGKIAWGRSHIGGDPIVVVLTESVSDAHLAGLRAEGVSYLFAGNEKIDLGLTLEILSHQLGIKSLLIEGGGKTNGAFLRAGLIDEISLILFPAVDGTKGAPSVFDSLGEETGVPAPVESMKLESSEVLEGGVVWLRYQLRNRAGPDHRSNSVPDVGLPKDPGGQLAAVRLSLADNETGDPSETPSLDQRLAVPQTEQGKGLSSDEARPSGSGPGFSPTA